MKKNIIIFISILAIVFAERGDLLSYDFVDSANVNDIGNYLNGEFGDFDFVWFDCGGPNEYAAFFSEYWNICSHYIICHFTYSNGQQNANFNAILNGIKGNTSIINIIEPNKYRQGSLTILKKNN